MENKKCKWMISQPMKGKTEDQIRAEREEIESYIAMDGGEVIDTVFPSFYEEETLDSDSIALRYLARSIDAMAYADKVVFLEGWRDARGCRMEYVTASAYGKKVFEFKDGIAKEIV
jgi:hypothetical protein